MQMLNVIDEEGNVLREVSREQIHREGLLHADVHVWFYTPDDMLIFQHRSKTKDTYPDLLDATVGGHVEIGDTCEETAVKETEEEVGVIVKPEDLVFLHKSITKSFDEATGTTNHHRRHVYAYRYTGNVEDLRIEDGEAVGFEVWSIDSFSNLSEEEKSRFIPSILTEVSEVIRQIRAMA